MVKKTCNMACDRARTLVLRWGPMMRHGGNNPNMEEIYVKDGGEVGEKVVLTIILLFWFVNTVVNPVVKAKGDASSIILYF